MGDLGEEDTDGESGKKWGKGWGQRNREIQRETSTIGEALLF